uniref:Uncharacterized protein n=1 Tax=Picea glauca TaxID=3330 RepID=A0A101M3L2_PICGL|nr:hypothetical protein ABT39_MTgene48 [Picea glauca]
MVYNQYAKITLVLPREFNLLSKITQLPKAMLCSRVSTCFIFTQPS